MSIRAGGGEDGQVRWWPGFVALSAIWGASFALIKVAVDAGVPPLWVAFWRCALGACALWAMLALRRERVPRERSVWGHSAVTALLLNSAPFVLFSYGETRISSVLAGVLNATVPLFTVAFGLLTRSGERPGAPQVAGLGVGLAGVLVLLGAWQTVGTGDLPGSLCCLAATCCYGAGFAYTKRYLSGSSYGVTGLSAVQISCAAVELLLVAPVVGGAPHWPGLGGAAALLPLGALGTGVAYVLNLGLIRTAGTTVASMVTYVTPLWSTALGAALLAEPVGWNTAVGGVLVIAAVALTRAPSAARGSDTERLRRGARPTPGSGT